MGLPQQTPTRLHHQLARLPICRKSRQVYLKAQIHSLCGLNGLLALVTAQSVCLYRMLMFLQEIQAHLPLLKYGNGFSLLAQVRQLQANLGLGFSPEAAGHLLQQVKYSMFGAHNSN